MIKFMKKLSVILTTKIYIRKPRIIESKVPDFEGLCSPTWLNHNQIDNRLDRGITGFFRIIKKKFIFYYRSGEEFHGIVRRNKIHTTKGLYT